MTSQAGLVLFGEFLHSLDLKREIDRAFGAPGSGAGYPASAYVLPLLLMLNGGGRSLSDLRMIGRDAGLLSLLGIDAVPSTDAFGRWLRRMGGKGPGLSALERVIDRVVTVLGKRLRRRRRKAGGAPRYRRDPDRGGEGKGPRDLEGRERIHAPGGTCAGTLRDAETVHTMNKTHNAFRLIVVRKRVQGSLPGLPTEPPSFETRYKVLATNHKEIPEWVLDWYNQRGEDSENRIKELKIGFGMERMPSGETKANALFFRIGVLAYNLFLLFRGEILSDAFDRAQIQTVRWQVYQVAGKVVRHAGALLLKVAEDVLGLFQNLRERSYRLMCREGVT
jgi:hypothetical protein|uniref:Transposase n=1 Tax=Leptospirillum sp. Group II '5-way CG' TaxID=419541 RepID=B6AMY8_9BACT|nr:MAG: transposase [Leptospirillum sp. Group II '5-way CG']